MSVFCTEILALSAGTDNTELKLQGGDSQNLLRFFITLGLKVLRLFRLKVLFEADIIKG